MRPLKNWSHLLCDWARKARPSWAWIGSCGLCQVGSCTGRRDSQLSILLQIKLVMISGVWSWESFWLNWACAACWAYCRGSHEHVSTCVVFSRSWLHAKHRPSFVLSNVCRWWLVGRRLFVYLEIWIRRQMESFLKDSPMCFQSIVSYVSSSQDFRAQWLCMNGGYGTASVLGCVLHLKCTYPLPWLLACHPGIVKLGFQWPTWERYLFVLEPFSRFCQPVRQCPHNYFSIAR
jgi:hypothetical protein